MRMEFKKASKNTTAYYKWLSNLNRIQNKQEFYRKQNKALEAD